MIEVIKCSCGKVFAACVDGSQDDEWKENKKQYLKAKCTIEYKERQDFVFESCKCPKTIKDIQKQSQFSLKI